MAKINCVTVRYGELRSTGYPSFSNKRYEVELSALLQEGDIPNDVKNELTHHARNAVKKEFGDKVNDNQMEIPF